MITYPVLSYVFLHDVCHGAVERDKLRHGTLLRQQKERMDRAAEWTDPDITVVVSDREWAVASQMADVDDDNDMSLCYHVHRLADRCPDPTSCTLWGQMGATLLCLHTHSCSCPDIGSGCVCKHILVVNREYPLPSLSATPHIQQYTENKLRTEHSFASAKANALGFAYSLLKDLESLTDDKLDLRLVLDHVRSAATLLNSLKRTTSVSVGDFQQSAETRVGQRTEADKQPVGYFPIKKPRRKATKQKVVPVDPSPLQALSSIADTSSSSASLTQNSPPAAENVKKKKKKREAELSEEVAHVSTDSLATVNASSTPSTEITSVSGVSLQQGVGHRSKKPKASVQTELSPTSLTLSPSAISLSHQTVAALPTQPHSSAPSIEKPRNKKKRQDAAEMDEKVVGLITEPNAALSGESHTHFEIACVLNASFVLGVTDFIKSKKHKVYSPPKQPSASIPSLPASSLPAEPKSSPAAAGTQKTKKRQKSSKHSEPSVSTNESQTFLAESKTEPPRSLLPYSQMSWSGLLPPSHRSNSHSSSSSLQELERTQRMSYDATVPVLSRSGYAIAALALPGKVLGSRKILS